MERVSQWKGYSQTMWWTMEGLELFEQPDLGAYISSMS